MKRIAVVVLILLSSVLNAQEGIQFSHGSWKEILAEAKAENKLIFIDMYTSWCGPCKAMVRDVFPLKTVGEKFNKSFINYKLDAEKGDGVEVAKKYNVYAYPTYLFVNGDGVLYYTSLGAFPEESFLKEADNALAEFTSEKPLPVWQSEYPARKTDSKFLLEYMQKRVKLALPADSILDQYATVSSKEDMLSPEILPFLLRQEGARADGPFFRFVSENKAEVAKRTGRQESAVNSILSRYVSVDMKRAVAKKDLSLMEKILQLKRLLSPGLEGEIDADQLRANYYSDTRDEKGLKKALELYSRSLLSYSRDSIKAADERQLKQFEEMVKTGRAKNMTAEQLESSRRYYSSVTAMNYAYRVRDMAGVAYKGVKDKGVLKAALRWMDVAAEFSSNFTIPEVRAGILYKLGRRDEAMQTQQKAIDSFKAIKLENEGIAKRLHDAMENMKSNKPTWITQKEETVVAR